MKEKTNEELKADRDKRIKELAKLDLVDLDSKVSESQQSAKFNKLFKKVRKGLLIIRAKKVVEEITAEEAMLQAKELFAKYSE